MLLTKLALIWTCLFFAGQFLIRTVFAVSAVFSGEGFSNDEALLLVLSYTVFILLIRETKRARG